MRSIKDIMTDEDGYITSKTKTISGAQLWVSLLMKWILSSTKRL